MSKMLIQLEIFVIDRETKTNLKKQFTPKFNFSVNFTHP